MKTADPLSTQSPVFVSSPVSHQRDSSRAVPFNEENASTDWGAVAMMIGGLIIATIVLYLAASGLIAFHGFGAISLYTVLSVVSATMMTIAISCFFGKTQTSCKG